MDAEIVNDYLSLKNKYKIRIIIERFLLFLIFIADIYILFYLFIKPESAKISLFTIIFPSFLFIMLISSNLIFLFKVKFDLNKSKRIKIGNFTLEKIRELTKEITQPLVKESKEVPNFYIIKSKQFEVSCINISFLNFIKFLNAVYIPEIIFSILTENEIKAIIAHEIAHFNFFKLPVTNTPAVLNLFEAVLPVLIVSFIGLSNFIYSVIGGVIFFILVKLFLRFLFASNLYKKVEFLCDYYASKNFGKLNFINGLLIGSKLSENTALIYKEVLKTIRISKDYSSDSLQEILIEVFLLIPYKILSRKEIKQLVARVFKSEKIQDLKENLNANDILERNKSLTNFESKYFGLGSFDIIDWKNFDFQKPKLRIDQKEYPYLIKSIEENPDKQLLDLQSENLFQTKYRTHPTATERILFLHKNLATN